MTCARAGAAPSLGLVPPLGSLRLRGLFPRCDRSRPGSLLRLGACPRLGLVPAWGHSLSGPLPSGAAPAGAAPAWGPLPLWAAPAQGAPAWGPLRLRGCSRARVCSLAWGRSRAGVAPFPGALPPGGRSTRRGRSRLGSLRLRGRSPPDGQGGCPLLTRPLFLRAL